MCSSEVWAGSSAQSLKRLKPGVSQAMSSSGRAWEKSLPSSFRLLAAVSLQLESGIPVSLLVVHWDHSELLGPPSPHGPLTAQLLLPQGQKETLSRVC